MRTLVVGVELAIIVQLSVLVVEAVEPASVRQIDRIAFEGIEAFELQQVREILAIDFDLWVAAHPKNKLPNYLKAIEEVLGGGYRRCGFPRAEIQASYHERLQRIGVRVVEGVRYRCGDVRVVGAKQMPVEQLVESVTEDASISKIIWKKGAPAPFDEVTAQLTRKRIADAFANEGFLSPKFDSKIWTGVGADAAIMEISVIDEGPRASVGTVYVFGTKRDASDDVLKYLNLHTGKPLDARMQSDVPRRLLDSGRYVSAVIRRGMMPSATGPEWQSFDLRIDVKEYDLAPPLKQELSAVERALLRLKDWLEGWSRGDWDDDIVVSATWKLNQVVNAGFSAGPTTAGADHKMNRMCRMRAILAPSRGQTVSFSTLDADFNELTEAAFANCPDRFVMGSPARRVKLELANDGATQLALQINTLAAATQNIGDPPFLANLSISFSSRRNRKDATPLKVTPRLLPASVLSLAHYRDSQCALRNGEWEIHNPKFRVRFDDASGRLLKAEFSNAADAGLLTIWAEKGALRAEVQRIETQLAAANAAYNSGTPWKSTLEFLLDEMIPIGASLGPSERTESWRALRKLVRRWSPPRIAELMEQRVNRLPEAVDPLRIPSHRSSWTIADWPAWNLQAKKNTVGMLLPVYRRLVPQAGWIWPIGRDAALHAVSPSAISEEALREAVESNEVGPLTELFLATAVSFSIPQIGEAARNASFERLTVKHFQYDYRPFLTGDSWLGRAVISLAEAARTLDDSELQALVRLLPEKAPHEAISRSILLLKNDPDRPVEELLSAALDHAWNDALRSQAISAVWQSLLGTTRAIRQPDKADRDRPAPK
jgi:hypothetical protein